MLKLTTQHIDQIRNYFLAETKEESNALQRNIAPYFLSGFLIELKELFINHPLDEERLRSIGKSMGAEEHINSLKEIQQSYYEHLARLYVIGIINEDLEKLLNVNNKIFNEEIEYYSNLSKVFRTHEREKLKKKFQLIEGQSKIHDIEITDAFKQIERDRLKSIFKNSNIEEEVPVAALVPNDSTRTLGSKNRNIWRPIAIAASIVGFIVLAGYLFILREEKIENSRIAKNNEFESALFGSKNNLTENQKIYEVREQRLLGFVDNEKADSLTVEVRDVKSMSGLIEFKKAILLNEFDNVKENDLAAKNIDRILDSLNSLQNYLLSIFNTYTYDPNKKSLILNISSTDSIFGIYRYSIKGNKFLISVNLNNKFYNIKQGSIIYPLIEVLNEKDLDELKKIEDWYKIINNPLNCVNSENQFYEYYKNMDGRLGPVAGIWKLDNYIEAWDDKKIISVDSIIDISSWVIFPIFYNKYKVCDIDKGFQGEKAEKDFIAFFEKVSDKFVYSCQFLYANCSVTSEVSFQNKNHFEIEYFLPEPLLRLQPTDNKNIRIKWRFKWQRVYPKPKDF